MTKLPKPIAVLLLAMLAVAPQLPAQTVEAWQKTAVWKYPALAQAGSPLNQRFLAIVAEKQKSDPAFFTKSNWPVRAADAAAEALQAEEKAAEEKAKAEEAARLAKMTPEEQEWDRNKARWVFERLIFGDGDEVVASKLNGSKLITKRVPPDARAPLGSRFQWVLGESKFNLDFEMKPLLSAIIFENRPEKTSNLDSFIHDDWARLRAAAIEYFGQPVKSIDFPADAKKLEHGALTLTDTWERPDCHIQLGLTEDEGRATVSMRISAPARGPE